MDDRETLRSARILRGSIAMEEYVAKNIRSRVLTVSKGLIVVLALASGSACREEGTVEGAGREMDETLEELDRGSEERLEQLGRELDEAAEEAGEAADEVKDAAEDAAR